MASNVWNPVGIIWFSGSKKPLNAQKWVWQQTDEILCFLLTVFSLVGQLNCIGKFDFSIDISKVDSVPTSRILKTMKFKVSFIPPFKSK
jgi:hypothetical protein